MVWFWVSVGVLAWMIIFSIGMMTLIHRRNMKALKLLRGYAERGAAPPSLAELLGEPPPRSATGGRP